MSRRKSRRNTLAMLKWSESFNRLARNLNSKESVVVELLLAMKNALDANNYSADRSRVNAFRSAQKQVAEMLGLPPPRAREPRGDSIEDTVSEKTKSSSGAISEDLIEGIAIVVGSPFASADNKLAVDLYAGFNPSWSRRQAVHLMQTDQDIPLDGMKPCTDPLMTSDYAKKRLKNGCNVLMQFGEAEFEKKGGANPGKFAVRIGAFTFVRGEGTDTTKLIGVTGPLSWKA
jgi:hypothetical protein